MWATIAVAVDSGAVAHVSPPNVFSLTIGDKTAGKGKYFAADGNPMDKMGSQGVRGQDVNGVGLSLEVDAVNVTKALAPLYSIAKTGDRLVFEDTGGYIYNIQSNKTTQLRLDSKLYYLDLRVEVAESSVRSSPFTRKQGR